MNSSRLIVVTDQGVSPTFASLFPSIEDSPDKIRKNDIVLFEGGTDVDPRLYGERQGKFTQRPDIARDNRERLFFIKAQKAGAACFGICRGSQFLTAMSGGKLIQDVTGHTQNHLMRCKEEIDDMWITSTHHQMMFPFNLPKEDYDIFGWSSKRRSEWYLNGDNLEKEEPPVEPEIVWYPKTRSLAIQGHPEYMNKYEPFPEYCRELIKRLIFGEN